MNNKTKKTFKVSLLATVMVAMIISVSGMVDAQSQLKDEHAEKMISLYTEKTNLEKSNSSTVNVDNEIAKELKIQAEIDNIKAEKLKMEPQLKTTLKNAQVLVENSDIKFNLLGVNPEHKALEVVVPSSVEEKQIRELVGDIPLYITVDTNVPTLKSCTSTTANCDL